MEGSPNTSINDMSFELTGPPVLIPLTQHLQSRSPKRDFTAFNDDPSFRPAEQDDRTTLTHNPRDQTSDIDMEDGEHIQHQVSDWIQWGLFCSLQAFHFTCEILKAVYSATAIAAMPVAAAKRRLVSFTQETSTPAPVRRLLWPHRAAPRLFRQNASTSPGLQCTNPITPPRFRSAASSPFHVPGRFPISPFSFPVRELHNVPSPSIENSIYDPMLPAIDVVHASSSAVTDNVTHAQDMVTRLEEDSMILDDDSTTDEIMPVHDRVSPTEFLKPHRALDANQLASIKALEEIREMSREESAYDTPPHHNDSQDRRMPSNEELLASARSFMARLKKDDPAGRLGFRDINRPLSAQTTDRLSNITEVVGQPQSTAEQELEQRNSQPTATVDSSEDSVAQTVEQASGATILQGSTESQTLPELVQQALEPSDIVDLGHSTAGYDLRQQFTESSGLIESTRSPEEQHSAHQASQTNGLIESTRSSEEQHLNQHALQPKRPIGSTQSPIGRLSESQASELDGWIESDRSPSESLLTQQASDPEGSIESTRSPPIEVKLTGAPITPLRSSLANSARIAASRGSHRSAGGKGWLRQVMSSFNARKPGSPLREAFNSGNPRTFSTKTPKNARFLDNPVTGTKKYVKDEAISYPSPISSRDESSLMVQSAGPDGLMMSPTQQEQDAMIAEQLVGSSLGMFGHGSDVEGSIESSIVSGWGHSYSSHENLGTVSDGSSDGQDSASNSPSDNGSSEQLFVSPTTSRNDGPQTPQNSLFRDFGELTVSSRRTSLRARQKAEKDRLRAEQEAIAAAEKARKDKEAAQKKALKEKAEAEEKARKEREEAEEKAHKEKAGAEEKARKDALEEEERKKYARRTPIEKVIQPLSEEWESKLVAALAQGHSRQVATNTRGNPITRRDIGMVLPQRGSGDAMSGWLNDVIIEAYLLAVVAHANRVQKRGQTPKQHAFNNFFYNNLNEGAVDKALRWTKRAKIGGKDLLKVEWVYIPVNMHGNHWTLLVVSPTQKTIEYFDSFNGKVTKQIENVMAWLKAELGNAFKADEWKVVEDPTTPGMGKGPRQSNGSDCGMFTVTTAKMISLGVEPMAISASDMPVQRRRLVAELIHGSFTEEFEPRIVFE